MTRPRVALISLSGGDSAAWLAGALAGRADVHFLVPAEKAVYLQPDLGAGVSVATFRFSRFYRPLRQARDCWRVAQIVRQVDPDVVHLQQGHHLFNLLLWRLRRYPLVVTAHEPAERGRARHGPRRRPQRVVDLAFRRADRLIVHGEHVRAAVAARGVRPEAIGVIGRPAPRLVGDWGSASNGRDPGEPPVVLFFGRIWPYKGLEYLIEAEPLVAADVPDVTTVIAGEGEDIGRYRALMAEPGRFEVETRFVSREQRDRLFARASVVVLPYVDASTSAVVPIAYLHGKPVVVTSAGGLAQDVDPGRTGLVVPPRDPGALAEALVRLLRDHDLRRALGEAGRRKLEREFAPDVIAQRTLDVYSLAQEERPERGASVRPAGPVAQRLEQRTHNP